MRNIRCLFRGRGGVGCLFLLCEAGGANPSVSNIVSPVSEECPAPDIMRACMHRGVKDSQGPGECLEIKMMMTAEMMTLMMIGWWWSGARWDRMQAAKA